MKAVVMRDFQRSGFVIEIGDVDWVPLGTVTFRSDAVGSLSLRRGVTVGFVSDERIAEMATEATLRDALGDGWVDGVLPRPSGLVEATYARPEHAAAFGRVLAFLTRRDDLRQTWPFREAWMLGTLTLDM